MTIQDNLVLNGVLLKEFSQPYPFNLNDFQLFKSDEFKSKGGVYVIIKDEIEIVKIGQTNDFSKRICNYLNTNKKSKGSKQITRTKIRDKLLKESTYTIIFKEVPNERANLEKELLIAFTKSKKKLPDMNCNLS